MLEEQRVWKEKSQIDAMTHMFNKATTEAMINETIKTNNEALNALMVIDIDNFKSVNDTLGHKVGDHVICVIASVISSVVGVNDITGRFGGDEFVVMLRYINSQKEAEQIVAKIVDVVKKKENLTIPETISVSIGMAFLMMKRTVLNCLVKQMRHYIYLKRQERDVLVYMEENMTVRLLTGQNIRCLYGQHHVIL